MNLLLQDGGTAKPMNDLSLAVKLATFSPSNCMLSILPSNSPSFNGTQGRMLDLPRLYRVVIIFNEGQKHSTTVVFEWQRVVSISSNALDLIFNSAGDSKLRTSFFSFFIAPKVPLK